jgi:hypothetical protein
MTTPTGSTTRRRALITLGGVATSFAALALIGVEAAGTVALVTLWFAASGPGTVGTPGTASGPVDVDPRVVRRHRERHPGTTISEAVSAVRSGS